MLEQRQFTSSLGSLTRRVASGPSSAAAITLVVALTVAVSTLHGAETRQAAGSAILAPGMMTQAASEHALVRAAPANGQVNDRQASDVAQQRRVGPEARPPLKLTAEQRNIASFVASKYRVGVDEVQSFVAHAYRAARDFRLDPYLILAVVAIESSFNPNARSPKGAQGLMQVLTRVHTDKFEPFGGASAAFDPDANITVGSAILKEYMVRAGSVEGALKSYVGAALLPHDFGYGRKVLSERNRIAAAAQGQSSANRATRALGKEPVAPALSVIPDAARVGPNSGVPGDTKRVGAFAATAKGGVPLARLETDSDRRLD